MGVKEAHFKWYKEPQKVQKMTYLTVNVSKMRCKTEKTGETLEYVM